MSKIDLNNVAGGFNLSKINDNFQKIETALNDGALWRDNPDGEPNQMKNDLDMNGHRIYNLPAPVAENEPARYKEIQDVQLAIDQAHLDAQRAKDEADRAKYEADRATAAAGSSDASNLKVFSTKADAEFAAATLPDGQEVIAHDVQERYKVQGGALVFVEKLLSKSLADPNGSELVSYGEKSVSDSLTQLFNSKQNAAFQKKLLLSLPFKHPEWDWVVSTYNVKSYPQTFVVDEYSRKLLIIDGNTPKIIQVYHWPSGIWDRVIVANASITSEGAVVRKEGNKIYLYLRTTGNLLAKFDITTYPGNRSEISPSEITNISTRRNFCEFNGTWTLSEALSNGINTEERREHLYKRTDSGEYTPYDLPGLSLGALEGTPFQHQLPKCQGFCDDSGKLIVTFGGQQRLNAPFRAFGLNGVRVFDQTGNILVDALIDPFAISDFLKTKGQDPSIIENEGCTRLSNGSILSMLITQDWDNPRYETEGIVIFQEFATEDYHDFSSSAVNRKYSVPCTMTKSTMSSGTGFIDPATGELLDDVLKIAKYMAKYSVTDLTGYTSNTPVKRLDGTALPSGTLIRFRMGNSKMFYYELLSFNKFSRFRLYLNGSSVWVEEQTQQPIFAQSYSVSPADTGEISFQRSSDTSLTLRMKGGDGIVRSVSLTLS